MIQQINLYHKEFRKIKPRFHARVMFLALVAVVALLLLFTVYGFYDRNERRAELTGLEAQQRQLQDQLVQVRKQLEARSGNQLLASRNEKLVKELQDARRLANLLAGEIERPVHPYSSIFRALAEAVVDGLWIEQVTVSRTGRQIMLGGSTRYPELVPQLLQALKSQPAFEGRTFEQVMMQRPDPKQDALRFEMQALKETAGDRP